MSFYFTCVYCSSSLIEFASVLKHCSGIHFLSQSEAEASKLSQSKNSKILTLSLTDLIWGHEATVKYDYPAHLNKSLYELNCLPPGSCGVLIVQRLDLFGDLPEPCLQVRCEGTQKKKKLISPLWGNFSNSSFPAATIKSKRLHSCRCHLSIYAVDECSSPFFSTLVRGLTPEKTSASSVILSDPSFL